MLKGINAKAVRWEQAGVSEKIHEQSSHQVCVHDLSMTVHLDELFIKTNGKYIHTE